MKCEKCKSVNVIVSSDGGLGLRGHCLKCGRIVPATADDIPPAIKPAKKAAK